MHENELKHLRCPVCTGRLHLVSRARREDELRSGGLICSCGRAFSVIDGIPDLVFPEELAPSDAKSQHEGDTTAQGYEAWLGWLFATLGDEEDRVRRQMIDQLDLSPGARVLEIGCGTGRDTVLIAERVGPEGSIHACDLSRGMVDIARQQPGIARTSIAWSLCNAAYLPFADDTFDAVFHFGGLNTFGEMKRALTDMTRVVRVGGKVVVGDESVPPWLRGELFGQVLMHWNHLYAHDPPLEMLPSNAREVCMRWILGNAFFLIDYRVGEGMPELDMDIPIPFKGDTLRMRFEGQSAPRAAAPEPMVTTSVEQ